MAMNANTICHSISKMDWSQNLFFLNQKSKTEQKMWKIKIDNFTTTLRAKMIYC